MTTPLPTPLAKTLDDDRRTGMTMLYEDRPTVLRGKQFCDQLKDCVELHPEGMTCWRVEMLEMPEIAREAGLEARASEFLVLSLRGDGMLAFSSKRWIEEWLSAVGNDFACLVVLFDSERSVASHAGATRHYLRTAAEEVGVGFFAHFTFKPGQSCKSANPTFEVLQRELNPVEPSTAKPFAPSGAKIANHTFRKTAA